MRQLRLIPSGLQLWHRDMIAATNDAFAYSSTLALHIFRLKDNVLQKTIAAHERAISAICWCPDDSNLLATCSVSGRVAIWDLESEDERYKAKVSDPPQLMDWSPVGDKIALVLDNGDVLLWEYKEADKLTKVFSLGSNSASGAKVLRWHPRDGIRLLVGCADGSLVVYNQRTGKKLSITGKAKTSKEPISDAQWDPLSEDYLLAAWQDGNLTLFDASTQKEIHSFEKQPQGIRSLAWAAAQPGNFVTTTDRVGVLRLWNVSQRSPIAQIKVGSAGVNCIKAVPNEPNWFILAFKNSSVGVCDIGTRTMRFTSTSGHSETIFDAVFHPEDPDMLATASYDGYVKLWQVTSMECRREMYAGKDQLLYGLAWGPNATRLCAVSSTGDLFIWNVASGEQIFRQHLHNGQAYRCDWNSLGRTEGTGEIATGGADGFACVTDAATGVVLRKLTHPGAVIGVDWHGTRDGLLATACQDGQVRLYFLTEPGMPLQASGTLDGVPQVILSGHEARVFNIAFHPLCPMLIASGSDDKTVRVWNWQPENSGSQELRRMGGHTAYVRGLLWHSELAHILFSGSWDATIRVWNVATGTCLHVAHEHHADVYGLTLHPKRPFLLVSSSRDTTIRFWVFEDLVRPLVTQAIVRPDRLGEVLGAGSEEAYQDAVGSENSPPLRLYGEASRSLFHAVAGLLTGEAPGRKVYELIISFFMYRQGIEDLWGLIAILRGEPSVGAARNAFHEHELIACQKSKALELASARVNLSVSMKYEDRLMKAAQIMLRVGDLRSYCRFVAQAGNWEKAICIAPAVSHQFWVEMCNEYIETLSASTEIDEAAPFWIATGKATRLIEACVERSDLDTAFVVAKADCDGLLPAAIAGDSASAAAGAPSPQGNDARMRLEDVAASLAARYADLGEPLQAAMCFLAVTAPARAVTSLSRAHEHVLSFVVAELLSQPQDPVVVKLLADCAERDQRWHISADILRRLPEADTFHLPLLAARMPATAQDVARSISPVTEEEYQVNLADAIVRGDTPAAVLCAVCAGDGAQAADLATQALHVLFARGGWAVPEARALIGPLESLPLEKLAVKDIANTLSCAAFVGLVEASSLGFQELMFPLAQTLRNLITHQNLSFPVSLADIGLLEAFGCMAMDPARALQLMNNLLSDAETPEHVRSQCQQQIAAIQQRPTDQGPPAADGPGLARMAGGLLPSCYKRYAKNSVLTNSLIRGPAFELEHTKLHISLSDALAWARVNAFSPLNTGCKIHPV